MRDPITFLVFLTDGDGFLLPGKTHLEPYLLAMLIALEKPLHNSLQDSPVLADYFRAGTKNKLSVESDLLESITEFAPPLIAEFKKGNEANKEIMDKIVKIILLKPKIKSILENLRPFYKKNNRETELIYRAFFIIAINGLVIETNRFFLAFIQKIVKKLQVESPKKKFISILADSSLRQSTETDIFNYQNNHNGLMNQILPFFYEYGFKKALASIGCETIFFPLLVADYTCSKLKIGNTLFFREDRLESKPKLISALSGKSKAFFISRLLTLLSVTPYEEQLPEQVLAYMFDDSRRILDSHHSIMLSSPRALSKSVTLNLIKNVNGDQKFYLYPKLTGEQDPNVLQGLHTQSIHYLKGEKKFEENGDNYLALRFGGKSSNGIFYRALSFTEIKSAEQKLDKKPIYSSLALQRLIAQSNQMFWNSAQLVLEETDSLWKNYKKFIRSHHEEPQMADDSKEFSFLFKRKNQDLIYQSRYGLENSDGVSLLYDLLEDNPTQFSFKLYSSQENGDLRLDFKDNEQLCEFKIFIYKILLNVILTSFNKEYSSSFWSYIFSGPSVKINKLIALMTELKTDSPIKLSETYKALSLEYGNGAGLPETLKEIFLELSSCCGKLISVKTSEADLIKLHNSKTVQTSLR